MSLISKLTQYIKINNDLLNFTAEKLESIPIVDGGIIVLDGDVTAQSQKDIKVKFNKNFPDTPNIIVALTSSSTGSRNSNLEAVALYGSQTKDGFTIRLFNNDTAARRPGIVWQAIYDSTGGGSRLRLSPILTIMVVRIC